MNYGTIKWFLKFSVGFFFHLAPNLFLNYVPIGAYLKILNHLNHTVATECVRLACVVEIRSELAVESERDRSVPRACLVRRLPHHSHLYGGTRLKSDAE